MNISELSIRRPVLATVLTVIILLFGMIGYTTLGVREYPSVDNPIISVTCSYSGANADVIENQITEPLEQNINGIPGIRSLSSVSQQGQCRITVEFELSVDLETAANDVRDKVSRAQRYLPRDCDPPTVSKADADASPILMVAIQSNSRSLLELSEIADLTVKEQLQTISDVSSVSIWGEKRYSMRLWLDPVRMAGYGITPVDIKNAMDNENVELPSGSIEGNTVELTLRTMGQMHSAEEFNNVVIKEVDGQIIRLSDIGYAELGAADLKSYMKMNGVPMVGVVVIPQPGANHIEIADAVYERMEQMRKDLPDDVDFSYGFDNTKFIRASIAEVESTVYEAFVLVIIIIFLFLRDWRVTLVPCIVIPVSLIGAFFVMYVAGFSINVLTMLAVVLSVGLVVDDAIVMTENIYIRIERGMKPFDAGYRGSEGNLLRRHLHHRHPGGRVPAYRLHGRYQRTSVPRVQLRSGRFRHHLIFRGTDLYPDAIHQTAAEAGKTELVLPEDGTVLRRLEPRLLQGPGKFPETKGHCHSVHPPHPGAHRLSLEQDSGRNGSAGRPFANQHQYERSRRSELRIPARLYRRHQPAGRFHCSRRPVCHRPCIER